MLLAWVYNDFMTVFIQHCRHLCHRYKESSMLWCTAGPEKSSAEHSAFQLRGYSFYEKEEEGCTTNPMTIAVVGVYSMYPDTIHDYCICM